MTFLQEITDLKERIARAQSERDAWRASGLQEKYLEAHSLTEALELQLERLQPEVSALPAQGSVSYNGRLYARYNPGEAESQRELMDSLAITFRDGVYHLGDYRYDRLADAVNYARLRRTQGIRGS